MINNLPKDVIVHEIFSYLTPVDNISLCQSDTLSEYSNEIKTKALKAIASQAARQRRNFHLSTAKKEMTKPFGSIHPSINYIAECLCDYKPSNNVDYSDLRLPREIFIYLIKCEITEYHKLEEFDILIQHLDYLFSKFLNPDHLPDNRVDMSSYRMELPPIHIIPLSNSVE